ncbi:M23 family metallopeptidase [Oryzobacter terrae]|uniref:M23 family metallopeptidase n=1 Tax=Oryzobacter terrae TaxID=1620385 RepID=UPI00366A5E62
MLPTAVAATLVVTAAGITMAQTAAGEQRTTRAAATVLDLDATQVVAVREAQAAEVATTVEIAERRQAAVLQTSAVKGRVEAKQRAARVAARKAAEEKKRQAAEKKRKARVAAARAKAERASHRWVRAIRTGLLTSDFGPRWGKTHDGLDIGASTGTPLYAMSKGTVILSDEVFSFGNKVEIRYWDGTVSWYGHLSRRDVRTGDTVMPGDQVGLVGNTGHSFGSHLHLEIHPTGGDNPVDPAPWLRQRGIMVG